MGLVVVLARFWRTTTASVPLMLTAVVPWAVPCFVLVLVGAALAFTALRRWAVVVAVVAALGIAQVAVWEAPSYVGTRPHGPADVTVMELNMYFGLADPQRVVRLVRDDSVDVLVLTEATPGAFNGLLQDGLTRVLPHHVGFAQPGRYGVMAFSRFPLSGERLLALSRGGLETKVGGRHPFTLLAGHAGQPLVDGAQWASDLALVRRTAATITGPLVVVGDFNSTLDSAPVRGLLADGFRDAAEQSNAGWQPTWPGATGGPPLLRRIGVFAIDHVLVRGLSAVHTSTAAVADTDHRALVADLRIAQPMPKPPK